MTNEYIVSKLPYSQPFLFVDELLHVDENGAEGTFTFQENMPFYEGHFKDNPVTPGVILSEVMAQIGVACLGIYLVADELTEQTKIAMSSMDIEFLKPVFPGEKVTVKSRKIYFRFGKLKCEVDLYNSRGEQACSGKISGIIIQ
ncbi:MAG: hydroxymyristoyl-ACP dehydratase [Flavobacterium sp.]|nr:MAG: hydroxymyristoyl-ACP dehydratase [Flavobacterium sp.]